MESLTITLFRHTKCYRSSTNFTLCSRKAWRNAGNLPLVSSILYPPKTAVQSTSMFIRSIHTWKARRWCIGLADGVRERVLGATCIDHHYPINNMTYFTIQLVSLNLELY
ncbi:hypothetical protein N7G274_007717 [Stereocaulon virgatum]|uniref:Uncharacterized protein n=1 Tax=Stereocaulon virgatum TaxID=373712 RepID=A0ABR4A1Y4_9LECA